MNTVRYRLLELFPAVLAWGTFALMIAVSAWAPVVAAVFIILFDVYWLLKTFYLMAHLRATYQEMKRNMEVSWRRELETDARTKDRWKTVSHLVVLPMVREPFEVVRESFSRLAEANYPKEKFFVVLATEERAGAAAQETAARIEREFKNTFGGFMTTSHPDGISGEIPGKGSNETWAVKEARTRLLGPNGIRDEDVMVSVFDVDTQIYPEYFGRLTHLFLTVPDPHRAIYQPIPLFVNNIYQAPALARVIAFSSSFWQMMQQSRHERLTSFSSQAWPLKTLVEIGYWQTDVVAEDSRGFWQGLLHYDGDFRCVPLTYPVAMDANVAPTFWGTMKNLYRQQRRWAWGVEDVPYALDGFMRNHRIPFRKKLYWSFNIVEGFHSWATNAIMIFALGWLPVMLGGAAFNATMLSYNLPQTTAMIVNVSMLGVLVTAIVSVLLLPPKPEWFGRRHYGLYVLEWIFIPVTLIVFGCIPAIEAQTRLALGGRFRLGFWVTPKGRYPETEKGVGENRKGFPRVGKN